MKKVEIIRRIMDAQAELERKLPQAQNAMKNLESIFKECTEKLRQLSNDSLTSLDDSKRKEIISHFVKGWFRSYLGTLDELMVLNNGVVFREYHKNEHEKFKHDRHDQNDYYKESTNSQNKKSSDFLSLCSVDGINFEILKYEKLLENQDLSKVDQCGRTLDTLLEKIFEIETNFWNELVSFGIEEPLLQSGNAYLRNQTITFETLKLKFRRSDDFFSKCSRSQSLASQVEECIALEDALKALKSAGKKRKSQVIDSDDEREQTSRQQTLDRQKQLEEDMKAKRLTDFGMEVSVEQIKRDYTVSTEPKHPPVVTPSLAISATNEDLNIDLSAWRLAPLPIQQEEDNLPLPVTTKEVKFMIVGAGQKELTTKSVQLVSVPLTTSSSTSTSTSNELVFSCSEVLDDLTLQLWVDYSTGKLNELHLPARIQMDGQLFQRGSHLNLSVSAEALKTKRKYPVLLETSSSIRAFLTHLAAWWVKRAVPATTTNTTTHHSATIYAAIASDAIERTNLLWQHKKIILSAVKYLSERDNESEEEVEEKSSENNIFKNMEKKAFHLCECEQIDGLLLASILHAVGFAIDKDLQYLPAINISYLNCYNDHLAVLLKNTKCLLAVSCGITLTHLQSAMQQMTKYSSPVEQLDLSFNLCGNSSQKGFKDVFLWLATNFKHLKDLNCSYCAVSGRDMRLLCEVLAEGLLSRVKDANLTPLDSVTIRGLQASQLLLNSNSETAFVRKIVDGSAIDMI